MNDYNILVNNNRIIGFIDFGDIVETATICELAIAIAYAILNKTDPIACAVTILKGYHDVFPLQENEIAVLFDLICLRLCVSVVNSEIAKNAKPDDAYYVISEKPAWDLLKKLRTFNADEITALFSNACQMVQLKKDRQKWLSKNLTLSYANNPLHIIKGQGQYLFDKNGRRYLDCINNVAHVGHCHPKVVAAGQKQMAILNTNTRYLHENLTQYAQQLVATLPAPLEVCFFVCTGSEANELALRLAMAHTNRARFLVMDHAYHGNTSTLINISPYKFNGRGGKGQPDFVDMLALPQQTHNEFTVKENIAAFICEPLLSCAGQIILPENYLQTVYQAVKKIGGVCIADEVQVGLGRVGTHFWGFETQSVVPDIVTIGKPLGNGHPLAAVVTTKEIAESFCNGMEYFNTFGGNPVSCAIGLAVLQVIAEENLQQHAFQTGEYFKQQLTTLKTKHACIKDVRGLGLFLGIELEDEHIANLIMNAMRDRGILVSTDGPLRNVIKLKPPMVFTLEDSQFFVQNLDEILLGLKS